MSRPFGFVLALILVSPLDALAQLHSRGSQLWHQGSTGVGSDPEYGDVFGEALAAGDFDGDGHVDLAIGAPGEGLLGVERAGIVQVLYGAANGLSASRTQYWAQASGAVPGTVEADDRFGATLASGDFNGDGYADLAIGAPNEALGTMANAGAVAVLYGSSNGLTDEGSDFWTQDSNGLSTEAKPDERFGAALAAGDFNNDGRDDLAIGTPNEGMNGGIGVGIVQVLRGSDWGLTWAGSQVWSQHTPGVPGEPQVNAHFGQALTSGDFDGDGRDDLAIGSPGTTVATFAYAGAVTVLYGSQGIGLTADRAWYFHRSSEGIGGSPAPYAAFGRTLASGDFNADGRADLVVGAPLDGFGANGSGTLNVLHGGAQGLSTVSAFRHQGTDQNADGDGFAWALAVGDFDGDGYADLAAGVPGKQVGAFAEAGKVQVFHGGASGLDGSSQLWSQDSQSPDPVPGSAEWADRFGHSLAAGDFDGDGASDLAIGVRLEDIGNAVSAGAVNVLHGGDGLREAP